MGLERYMYVRVPDTCPSLTALSSVMPCTHGERVSPVSGAWNAWRACMPPRMQPRHTHAPRESRRRTYHAVLLVRVRLQVKVVRELTWRSRGAGWSQE